MAALLVAAEAHQISLFSVFRETANNAQAAGLPALKVAEADIHAVRNSQAVRGELVSATLFKPLPPAAQTYLAAAHGVFQSQFFRGLAGHAARARHRRGLCAAGVNLALPDAQAVYEELTR